MNKKSYPKPVLKPGYIYHSDNGRLICVECAGMSALYSGFDLSGQPVEAVHPSETVEWRRMFDKDMTCECNKTRYLQPT